MGRGQENVQGGLVAPMWHSVAAAGHDGVLLWCLVLPLFIYRLDRARHFENERAGRCAQALFQELS